LFCLQDIRHVVDVEYFRERPSLQAKSICHQGPLEIPQALFTPVDAAA
jgi:hypothetical protein